MSTEIANKGKLAKQVNETIRFTMWSVFKLEHVLGYADRAAEAEEVDALFAKLANEDVVVRGTYDVSGFKAGADLLIWWHSESPKALQAAFNSFRRTALGSRMETVWSQMAVHRPAEFNKSHIPAFMAEEESRAYVCVYPFVRSYEWYLLPDEDRHFMLREHGMQARDYPDVRANTMPAFALGDYEWILAFEADELYRIVDLMRELRASKARRHVRIETPFYTGPAYTLAELTELWP